MSGAAATVGRAGTTIAPVSFATRSMGGRLSIHLDSDSVAAAESGGAHAGETGTELAEAAARHVFTRVEAWAGRLTRHTETSDLSRLNSDPETAVPVRPTLAAALLAGRDAMLLAPGLVDITLLDARLAAELAEPAAGAPGAAGGRRWYVATGRHRSAIVGRPPGVRFDLGGVGKGWIADRALRLLMSLAAEAGIRGSAIVDADGDMAVRTAAGKYWDIAVDDPRLPDGQVATLRLGGSIAETWGIATSGTSIHRWSPTAGRGQDVRADEIRHHLIDPATGLPARTDVVQATVVAGSALQAEAYAKAAVIAGAARGLALLDRSPIRGAVLLLQNGDVLAVPRTLSLLADAA